MLITSSEHKNTSFTDLDELLAISRDIAAPVFIIPSGNGFQKPEKYLCWQTFQKVPVWS
jgi:hypothetical protein